MRFLGLRRFLALVLQISTFPLTTHAIIKPHYDVDSLVYMSTDIVLVRLSEDAQKAFAATVIETLFGSLRPNDRIEKLSPFLSFFNPMENGMKVVLFLDRRPRQYDFFHQDAAKSPFAVPPSGVYLVDEYDHVHEYFQMNNPGDYVAQGYSFFMEKRVPTKEQDLALPTLATTKDRISAAIKSVEPVRSLLEQTAMRKDVPALMHLIDLTSSSQVDCELRLANAIHERALQQLHSLQDPDLLLQAYVDAASSGDTGNAIKFIQPSYSSTDSKFADERVRYLVQTLSERKQNHAVRAAAVQILLNLGAFHSGPHTGSSRVLPIDETNWLKPYASDIQSKSRMIFDDTSESAHLRSLCLEFLSLEDAAIVADVKRVYEETSSAELRFAIEKIFLAESDELYQGLHASSGPVAARLSLMPECGCWMKAHNGTPFVIEYRERKDFSKEGQSIFPNAVLTDPKSHNHIVLQNVTNFGSSRSEVDGWVWFSWAPSSEIPAGKYLLTVEFARKDEILSTGYGIPVSIRKKKHAQRELYVR
jgi:hypothetical protein